MTLKAKDFSRDIKPVVFPKEITALIFAKIKEPEGIVIKGNIILDKRLAKAYRSCIFDQNSRLVTVDRDNTRRILTKREIKESIRAPLDKEILDTKSNKIKDFFAFIGKGMPKEDAFITKRDFNRLVLLRGSKRELSRSEFEQVRPILQKWTEKLLADCGNGTGELTQGDEEVFDLVKKAKKLGI